jgi:GT2 family glycosyltransferase
MNSYSIIIPSRNIENLTKCVEQIRAMGETARVIVVWDGDQKTECRALLPRDLQPSQTIWGADPFVFARNVNIGIRAAGTDDVVLVNDDALLKTPNGFAKLSQLIQQEWTYGAISPGFDLGGCRHVNLVNQRRKTLVREPIMLIFACCYIPRSTIDLVGLLDERFGINAGGPGKRGYGLEDDDYSLRIRQTGLKLGVYDGVLVDHTTLKSTFRHDPEHPADVKAHEKLFRDIHGHWPEGHGYAPR